MKRIVFMNMNDNTFFNEERRPRQRTNDFFVDPFDQYIAEGRERSNTSLKKPRPMHLARKISMSYSQHSNQVVNEVDRNEREQVFANKARIQEIKESYEPDLESMESVSVSNGFDYTNSSPSSHVVNLKVKQGSI